MNEVEDSERRLIIVGASSFGREVSSWIRRDRFLSANYKFSGYLDDNLSAMGEHTHHERNVISTIEGFEPLDSDLLLMAISEPAEKLKVSKLLMGRGAKFGKLIDSSVVLADHVSIGYGSVLCPNSIVSCDAKLGSFVTLNLGCSVGHDVCIGDGATLSSHSDVTGFARLGEGTFLGSHASILPSIEVGEYARVGAGSVVVRRVRPNTSVMGVPATKIA